MAIIDKPISTGALIERSFDATSALPSKMAVLALDLMVAFVATATSAYLWPAGPDELRVTLLLLAAWTLFLGRARLYTARFITRRSDELRRIFDATALTGASVAVAAFLFRLEVGRMWLVFAAAFGAIALGLERQLVRGHFNRRRRSGSASRRVLMIGENDESRALAEMFDEDRSLGYRVVGTIDPTSTTDRQQLTTLVLSTARDETASGAVIAATAIDIASSNRLLRDLMEAGLHVELSSTLADIDPRRLTVRPLGRFPVVYVEPIHRNGWRAVAKRAFDLSVAVAGMILATPLVAAIVVAVKAGSPGPVIFRQVRIGQNGVSFDVLKFRTMVDGAEGILDELQADDDGPLFKMKDDPRVTKAGRWLRKTSLDELPQLWNVIRGEMSLVGPRPALASEMAAWDEDLYGRLRVKPGITGMWQVSGRSTTSFEEYTRLDLYYVDNWSLVVDLAILARTIPAVLRSDGAY